MKFCIKMQDAALLPAAYVQVRFGGPGIGPIAFAV